MQKRAILARGIALFLFFLASPAIAQHAPAMWKMEDADSTVYFLGTIHILKKDTPWLSDELKAIAAEANSLTLELTPDETASPKVQRLVQELGFYPPDDGLSNHLPQEMMTKLSAQFQKLGIPTQALERMKPWTAGLQMTVISAIQAGFLPQYGVDVTLGQLATASGQDVYGLESAEEQINLFANLNTEEQVAFLKEGLEQIDDLNGFFEEMKDAWLTGDTKALDELLVDGLDEHTDLADKLIYHRNKNWVDPIAKLLDEPGTHLVAVGAGHLVGDKSVITLLRNAGYNVERY